MKIYLPWWLKIILKLILSKLPIPYSIWARLGVFRHGCMNQPKQALDGFLMHADTANMLGWNGKTPRFSRAGINVLELGPGDSAFTAVIAKAMGAQRVWLVDAGFFAVTDINAYKSLFAFLRKQDFPLINIQDPQSFSQVLSQSDTTYLTGGTKSLSDIDDKSVDFCFSNAVLEHIPRQEMTLLASELERVLKSGGVCVHRVDLQDHLGGELNNLRFSERLWESSFFRNAGFYTNRIRFGEMISVYEQAGFSCNVPHIIHWNQLPTPRASLDAQFRSLPEKELLVKGFDLVLTKTG
jgi:SAM-dependent methyltransferase